LPTSEISDLFANEALSFSLHRNHAEHTIRIVLANGKKEGFPNYRWDVDFSADTGTRTVRQDTLDLVAIVQRDRPGF